MEFVPSVIVNAAMRCTRNRVLPQFAGIGEPHCCLSSVRFFLRRFGECEEKCSGFSDLTLGPNCSAMTRDDAAHDGKADSGPLKLAFRVESLKHAKQAVRIFGL